MNWDQGKKRKKKTAKAPDQGPSVDPSFGIVSHVVDSSEGSVMYGLRWSESGDDRRGTM